MRSTFSIARGSLAETETFLMLAARTGLLAEQDLEVALTLASEVGRKLNILRQRLATPHSNATPKT